MVVWSARCGNQIVEGGNRGHAKGRKIVKGGEKVIKGGKNSSEIKGV